MANGDWSTPDPPTCDVGVIKLKPNPNLVEDFDAVIPFRHRTTDGHIAFGRPIPPPNWERNHFLRSAAGSGAAYRDDDGELRVLVRSWIASTHSTLILPHRDVTIRGQLMHELEVRIRRAWPDQISPLDTLRLTTVRPTPNVGYQGQRPLHVLVELNRPPHSHLHPILIAHREIDHNGPSPHIEWVPVLVATPVGVTTLHRICSPPCGAEQMLIPQPGRLRRWLQRDQGRPVLPGLFLPIWWDLRLQQPQGPVYGRDDQIDNDDDTAFLQYPLHMGRIGYQTFVPDDIVSLMQQQRTINIRLLGINHRFAFAQVNLEEPLAQQLRANWPLPRHRASDLLAVHYVPFPPNTIGSADEQLYLIELNDDRFTQVNTDDVLVLFSLSFTAPDAVRTQKIRVLWSPKRVTRELILTFLRLRWFCEQPETLCLLYLNNIHWPAGDAAISGVWFLAIMSGSSSAVSRFIGQTLNTRRMLSAVEGFSPAVLRLFVPNLMTHLVKIRQVIRHLLQGVAAQVETGTTLNMVKTTKKNLLRCCSFRPTSAMLSQRVNRI